MRRFPFGTGVLLLLITAGASADDRPLFQGIEVTPTVAAPAGDGFLVAPPARHGAVLVFPIVAPGVEADGQSEHIALPQAIAAGTLSIREMGSGGEVARLLVHNRGDQPVLARAGDVLQGGAQDRVITRDTILPPSDQPVAVQVNCVERGRWQEERTAFGYGGRAELGLRRVVQLGNDQRATWAAVDRLNGAKASTLEALGQSASDLAPETGTYMASIASTSAERQVDKAAKDLYDQLHKVHGIVGLVVVIDGRIYGSEVYGDPDLFLAVAQGSVEAIARDGLSAGALHRAAGSADTEAVATWFSDVVESTSVAVGPATGDRSRSFAVRGASGELVHLAAYGR